MAKLSTPLQALLKRLRAADSAAGKPTPAAAPETLHALRDIGLEADPRLLAVAHHVDAGSRLPFHDVPHRRLAPSAPRG